MGGNNKNFQKLHKELWIWKSENLLKESGDWPRWKSNGGDIHNVLNYCFACEAAVLNCDRCPIGSCYPESKEYANATSPSRKKYYALKMANKEWNDCLNDGDMDIKY